MNRRGLFRPNRKARRRLLIEGLERRDVLANSAPVDLTLSGGTVLENSAVGTEVAQLLAIDPDAGDTFSYALVAGSGDIDNGRFAVQANRLVSQGPFDYEFQRHLHVRLRATDSGGLSVERAFTVTVLELSDLAPLNFITAVSQAESQYYVELGGRVQTINEQSISADGRFQVFTATGRNLVATQFDSANSLDVYLYDHSTELIQLVSHGVDAPNAAADGDSRNPRISANGAFVAFESTATNLVVGQSVPAGPQIYLYEVATGGITLVSRAHTAATTPSNGTSQLTSISDNGGKVVFASNAINLISGQVDTNAGDDVFLYDRASNGLRLVSHSTANVQTAANNRSGSAQVSGDGLWVAYTSLATNLAAGTTDTNGADDIWLYNVATTQSSLVSHAASSTTTAALGASTAPVISVDGGVVAFESLATNLVTGQSDTNAVADIFRHDRVSNSSILVSHATGLVNTAGNGASTAAALSGDGQFLAYQSRAKNLTPGLAATKTRTDDDVFVYSFGDGLTVLVSHNSDNPSNAGNGRSWQPSISDDGQYIGYLSQASDLIDGGVDANGGLADAMVYDLVSDASGLANRSANDSLQSASGAADSIVVAALGGFAYFTSLGSDLADPILDNLGTRDAFNFDITTGVVQPANRSDLLAPATTTAGGASNQFSTYAASDDEQYWVFTSPGVDLMLGTTGAPPSLGSGPNHVYLYDQTTLGRTLVSHAAGSASTVSNGDSTTPLIAGDGSFVAFQSTATNLVSGQADTNAASDVFLYDVALGTIRMVSHQSASATSSANGASRPLAISADGRYVLFASAATNLVTSQVDGNGGEDLFLFDGSTGTVTLVTHAVGLPSTAANAATSTATMSDDGQTVAYASVASNLVTGQIDSVGTSDVFKYNTATFASSLVSHSTAGATLAANGASTTPRISKLGNAIAFLSGATNLISGQSDANGGNDVFLYDTVGNSLSLLSHTAANASQTGNGAAQDIAINGDGQFVAYTSVATNLIAGLTDTNGAADIFLIDTSLDTTSLVTQRLGSDNTTAGGGGIGTLAISDDGSYVVYDTTMTGLVAPLPGGAGSREVYQYDVIGDVTFLATSRPAEATAKTSRVTGLSLSGLTVGLVSDSDLLLDWDFNFLSDFFLWTTPFGPPNAAPTDIALSSSQVHELLPVGTTVGTLGTTDLDVGDSFFYELIEGPGGDNNGFFAIANGSLVTNSVFNQATQSSHRVRIRSTDETGDFVEKTFVIQITGDNNGPTDIQLSRAALLERLRGATVGTVTVVNPDLGATHQLSVNDARFAFSGNTLKLKTTEFLNRNVTTTVNLQITATDNAVPPHVFNKQFTLTVLANPTPWRNPLNSLDVFPDTFVAPQDALFVINELNAFGSHELIPPLETSLPLTSYYDTDGDNFVAPIDALLIINHLNALAGQEGESPVDTDMAFRSLVADPSDSVLIPATPLSPAPMMTNRQESVERMLTQVVSTPRWDASTVEELEVDVGLDQVGRDQDDAAWDKLLDELAADRSRASGGRKEV